MLSLNKLKINNFKKVNIDILKVLIGSFCISLGISILLAGDLGVDTISTLLLGILNVIEIPFWLVSMSFNITVLIIVTILNKQEIGIGSIINAVSIGLYLRYLNPYIYSVSTEIPFYSIFSVLLSPILLGVGGAVYISAGLGSAALEALTNTILLKSNASLKIVRMSIDASLVIIGIVLGARVGIGTLISILLIGPVLEFTLKVINYFKYKKLQLKV